MVSEKFCVTIQEKKNLYFLSRETKDFGKEVNMGKEKGERREAYSVHTSLHDNSQLVVTHQQKMRGYICQCFPLYTQSEGERSVYTTASLRLSKSMKLT